ncbi:MAG: hypothetical protein LBC77_04465 [Spirochaetaceae bacterium]|jgi:uncharacterized membrane protein|nr:hypothetical protein [Spirochaetaceae bacterium]
MMNNKKCFFAVTAFLFVAMIGVFMIRERQKKARVLEARQVIEAQPTATEKPVLYVTAVSPDILLNTKDGIRVTVFDERLNEKIIKFSNEKEMKRFLRDISENFTVVDYTGVYQERM